MYYFSDVQYKTILANRDDFDLKDSVLVNCQQMIETLLKWLLIDRDGMCFRSHDLSSLFKDLNEENYETYSVLLTDLTNCSYVVDNYVDYSKEEFTVMVDRSLELRTYLLSFKQPRTKKSNKF